MNIFTYLPKVKSGLLALSFGFLMTSHVNAETDITFATGFAGGSGQIGQTMTQFQKFVESESDGEIKVNLFSDGALGNEREILESLVIGSTDMSLAGISDVVYWLPEYFLSVPYLFESVEHVRKVYDGPIGQEIDQLMLEKKGLRTLAVMNRGARNVSSNRRIEKPSDMKGLRLRLPENPLWIAIWKQLEPVPATISFTELYTALQTGVVEAQENPLEAIVNAKFYEVQKYVALTGHVRDVYKIQISERKWKKLSKDEQTIIEKAAKKAAKFGDGLLADAEAAYIKTLKEAGTEVVEVSPQEFAAAMSKSKEIADTFLKPGLYQKVKEAAK
ncbi:TRAP transporter substrate-binding protein [Vibrio penaeicida]|uniref:TRAP transporter substrate-binding protein n=1 Tax=Vibrio penaeicida TaxID=104609 RepID=UPI0027339896|nr:TRAP transporter substrate-binding protein [Vibrio penaeicida]MDP2571382.1 TRAP transporter substrate-binding protein [Vibrio penaeicida]